MALFGNEARFFRFRVFFLACYLQNEVGDPPFFYISGITNSSSFNSKILREKSMIENFRANVLKLASFEKRNNLDEFIDIPTKAEKRSVI